MSGHQHFERSVDLPSTLAQSFGYHERPGALQRLIPPWENAAVVASDGSLQAGSRVTLRMRKFGLPLTWLAEHTDYDPPHLFADEQRKGPFAYWRHEHRFVALTHSSSGPTSDEANSLPPRSRLTDAVEYQLPLGPLGRLFGGRLARAELEQMFGYRHRVTAEDLACFERGNLPPQRIAISGASGLVGNNLAAFLQLGGHEIIRLVRHSSSADDEVALWQNPSEAEALNDCSAVIHLAGESIATDRWSPAKKERIRTSRVDKTRQLCETLARLQRPPSTLLCASATGIFGDRGDEILKEDSADGSDFLADVARQWEDACRPALDAGIRVVHLRFGIILTPRGGALAKMLLPAKLAGGRLGNGRQWWSWIALDDVLRAAYHCLAHDQISGPVNFVAPNAARNADFARTLGRVLRIPAIFPAPAAGLRLALGEMADALLLASTRVQPTVLEKNGFQFQFPQLEPALRHLLGRWSDEPSSSIS